jgi:hypothetical protein
MSAASTSPPLKLVEGIRTASTWPPSQPVLSSSRSVCPLQRSSDTRRKFRKARRVDNYSYSLGADGVLESMPSSRPPTAHSKLVLSLADAEALVPRPSLEESVLCLRAAGGSSAAHASGRDMGGLD